MEKLNVATSFAVLEPDHADGQQRVTMTGRVYLDLRDRLISGKLLPGQKLSIRAVADSLGVSMMPVREAFSRLLADGAVEIHPNRAISIPLMTRARFAELTQIRTAIEGFAAEEAARHRSAQDLAKIKRFDAKFRRAVSYPKTNVTDALQFNKDLHFAVYQAASLPSLVGIIESLWLKVGPVFNLDFQTSLRLRTSGAEAHHARLVAAIAAGDGPQARFALSEDIRTSSSFIFSLGLLPG